jgi:hypothetical protein
MKGKKKDELDISSLPEVNCMVCAINYLMKDPNIKQTKDIIMKTKRTDYSIVSREEVKMFAKERGLYAPIDDKKKDNKLVDNLPKEATPEVMAEAFALYVDDQLLTKRIEKKEINDAIQQGKPLPVKKKEEKKKDPKKKKEDDVEEVEEAYPKDYEHVFLFENYPETKEEAMALGNTKAGVCLLFMIRSITY